jgi:hypothetical protein
VPKDSRDLGNCTKHPDGCAGQAGGRTRAFFSTYANCIRLAAKISLMFLVVLYSIGAQFFGGGADSFLLDERPSPYYISSQQSFTEQIGRTLFSAAMLSSIRILGEATW